MLQPTAHRYIRRARNSVSRALPSPTGLFFPHSLTECLRNTDLVLLDVQGTLISSKGKIHQAGRFLNLLRSSGKDFLVVSNSSSHTEESEWQRLTSLMKLPLKREEVLTSGGLLTHHLSRTDSAGKVVVMGPKKSHELVTAAQKNPISPEDLKTTDKISHIVVTGRTRYMRDDLNTLAEILIDGHGPKKIIYANCDHEIPCGVPGMYLTGTRTVGEHIQKYLEERSGLPLFPVFLGKPSALLIQRAIFRHRESTGKTPPRNRITMVGDTLETDIKAAKREGIKSVLMTWEYGNSPTSLHHPAKRILYTGGPRPDYIADRFF